MKNKFIKAVLLAGLSCTALAAFGCENVDKGNDDPLEPPSEDLELITAYTDNSQSNNVATGFNKNLWYRNDLTLDMGDPMLVYDEASEKFYALGTRGGSSFEIFSSTNLSDWAQETMGGFTPRRQSWSREGLWAPDVQKIGDKWYLYYTANYKNPDPHYTDENHCQIGVAVADNPQGPYTQWTGTNADGVTIGEGDLPFYGKEHQTVLDQHVFKDDDGQLYMYFSYDTRYDPDDPLNDGTAVIYGVKMKDPVTWDLSTMTRLVAPGYKTINGSGKTEIPWETSSPSFAEPMECAEGPYMLKHGGKYYLTYCANSFVDIEYAVGYAESDKPLGPFVKPNETYLQNMICGVPTENHGDYISNRYLGFMTGTGHASVCKVGDEYLLAYHAHMNRDEWGVDSPFATGAKTEWRAIGYDYILFGSDGRPYSNGPTYTLQKLPDIVTGYTNLAPTATVTIDGKTTADCAFLIDRYTNRAYDPTGKEPNKEAQFKAGKHTIKLKLPEAKLIKAVNLYNSYDRSKVTDVISRIEFAGAGYISNARFNSSYLVDDYTNSAMTYHQNTVYPHAAYNIELTNKGVTTDTVTFIIECSHDFAVGEIEILGK